VCREAGPSRTSGVPRWRGPLGGLEPPLRGEEGRWRKKCERREECERKGGVPLNPLSRRVWEREGWGERGVWDPLSEGGGGGSRTPSPARPLLAIGKNPKGGGGSRTPLSGPSPACHREKNPRGVFGHLPIQACPASFSYNLHTPHPKESGEGGLWQKEEDI